MMHEALGPQLHRALVRPQSLLVRTRLQRLPIDDVNESSKDAINRGEFVVPAPDGVVREVLARVEFDGALRLFAHHSHEPHFFAVAGVHREPSEVDRLCDVRLRARWVHPLCSLSELNALAHARPSLLHRHRRVEARVRDGFAQPKEGVNRPIVRCDSRPVVPRCRLRIQSLFRLQSLLQQLGNVCMPRSSEPELWWREAPAALP
mmetsp:Transcript_16822/g.55023  ORF Transcript_16822/g.55023 Transcript_16822/m.55023 type:complete len:205 (+) Transcript_16822:237-851(+)